MKYKYHNKPICVDGIWFDSTSEGRYYEEVLKPLINAGKIRDLQMQVSYELIPPVYVNEVKHLKTKDKIVKKCIQQPTHYLADFVYVDVETGETKVVDVKGAVTKEFRLKEKMMLAFKGIKIIRVKMNRKTKSSTTKKTSSRPAPTKVIRPAIAPHPYYSSNGQPRPSKRSSTSR